MIKASRSALFVVFVNPAHTDGAVVSVNSTQVSSTLANSTLVNSLEVKPNTTMADNYKRKRSESLSYCHTDFCQDLAQEPSWHPSGLCHNAILTYAIMPYSRLPPVHPLPTLPLFTILSKILEYVSAEFCQILPHSAKSCQILPDSAWFCLILPDSADSCTTSSMKDSLIESTPPLLPYRLQGIENISAPLPSALFNCPPHFCPHFCLHWRRV